MDDHREYAQLTQAQNDALAGYTALDRVKIHSNTRKAIEAMACEGLPISMVADRFGIRRDNFARALNPLEVRQALNSLLRAIRDNAARAAYMRINEMAINAKSERVRLMANEWIAGVDGIAKVQKVEGRMRHHVEFGGFKYVRPDTLENKPSTDKK